MSSWVKKSPIKGFRHCDNCPPRAEKFSLNSPLSIGFGSIEISKDNEIIWSGDDDNVTLRRFERMARQDPNHDFRLSINGPLYGCVYQRHGDGEWILIERSEGFA